MLLHKIRLNWQDLGFIEPLLEQKYDSFWKIPIFVHDLKRFLFKIKHRLLFLQQHFYFFHIGLAGFGQSVCPITEQWIYLKIIYLKI
jgi:hypothetical protein